MSDIPRYVDERITARLRKRLFSATIVEKLPDGVSVMVQRLGFSTPEGPYPTERGVWGVLRAGDRCRVRSVSSVPVVGLPFEQSAGRPLNVLGEDTATEQTTSHTAWVTLLDVDPLFIPTDVAFNLQWKTEIETVGAAGATAKQVRLVFNGAEMITIGLQAADGFFWIPVKISSYAAGLSTLSRTVYFETSDPPSLVTSTVQEVTRVSIQARTNDTGEENDIVRCTELAVSL